MLERRFYYQPHFAFSQLEVAFFDAALLDQCLESRVVAPTSKSQVQPFVIQITNSNLPQKHLNH